MAEYQEIIINWEERKELKSLDDIINNSSNPEDVLYQLYGDSHIYGRDVLLYIGISTNKEKRLSQHLKGVFGLIQNLSFSIGKIKSQPSVELEIPESILIANHKPSYNKEFIHFLSSNATSHKIIVINNGYHGMLKNCCTNYWWIK